MSVNEKKHALDAQSAAQTEGSRPKKPKLTDDTAAALDVPAGPFVTGAVGAMAAAPFSAVKTEESNTAASLSSAATGAAGASNTGANNAATAATSSHPPQGVTAGPVALSEEEQRRKQEEIRKIEQEFSALKEKFFAEKIAALKKEIDQLTQGTHEGYLNEIRLLEEKKQRKLLQADQWRHYQVQCLNIAYEAEKKHSEDESLNDAKELQERMLKNMLKRRKQLEEQKADLNLNDAGPDLGRGRDAGNTRQLRKRGKESGQGGATSELLGAGSVTSEPVAKRTHVPEVRVTLSDDEVDADLLAIQRVRPSHATRQSTAASDLM